VQSLDYPICKTKYCWRSVDTQFHDGVSYVSCTDSNEKAATTSSMNDYHIASHRSPKIQHQKSLTLHWGSLSGWDRERVGIIFISEGSQYLDYEWRQPIAACLTQDAQPKLINAPLTLIFRFGQWPCHLLFCKEWLPVYWLWMALTT